MSADECVSAHCPHLKDVSTLCDILQYLDPFPKTIYNKIHVMQMHYYRIVSAAGINGAFSLKICGDITLPRSRTAGGTNLLSSYLEILLSTHTNIQSEYLFFYKY